MSPSYDPRKKVSTTAQAQGEESATTVTSQVWQKSGRCPKGTIPIRRPKEKILPQNENQIVHMRKKPIHHVAHNGTQNLHQANHSVCCLFILFELSSSSKIRVLNMQ